MDELIKQAAEEYIRALDSSLPEATACPHTFSKRFEKKMDRLIAQNRHPARTFLLRTAACLAAALLLLFGSVMAIDVDAREAFGKWLERQFDLYVHFRGIDTDAEENTTEYYPGWIPSQYDFYANIADSNGQTMLYVNAQGEFFQFSYSSASNTPEIYFYFYDTYDIKTVLINGLSGKLYLPKSEKNSSVLIWQAEDGTLLSVDGKCEEAVLIKAAENFRKK